MMSYWRERARQTITVIDASLPQDATLAERSRALRKAYPFGPRRCWPYKAWLKERRRYLVQHIRSIEDVPTRKLLPLELYLIEKAEVVGHA